MSTYKPLKVKRTLVSEGNDPFSYKAIETIAQNEHSTLELVQDASGKKLLRKTKRVKGDGDISFEKLQELQKREADFLMEANHPAFPKGYGYFNGSVEGMGWVTSFVREYVPGKSLEDFIKNSGTINIETAVDYARQIVEGLRYVHEKGFLFRDVKPSNMILEDRTKGNETPYGRIKLTDLDSLGRTQTDQGLGGSTFGVGTAGWTHPLQMMPGMASVQTDLFGVGTSLYYFLMGKQASFTIDKEGGVTFDSYDMELLEEKLASQDGGPELLKVLRRLVTPKETKQYPNTNEVLTDLEKTALICKEGYDALKGDPFVVYREPFYTRAWSAFRQGASSFFITASNILSTPIGAGVSLALLGGISTGAITSHYLQQESAARAIYFTPEISGDVAPITQVAIDINDLTMGVGALYVQLNTAETPNDVVLLRETKKLLERADSTSAHIETAQEISQPFAHPVSLIQNGGIQVRNSFRHTSVDNYITIIEQVPVTTCDSEGSCSTTYTMQTRQIYVDTDHYWTLNPQALKSGAGILEQGMEQMEIVKPNRIVTQAYMRDEIPSTDVLGRQIQDAEAYKRGQNEWIKDGVVAPFNALSNVNVVTDDRNVNDFYRDVEQGISSAKYPSRSHVNNTCISCDERGAPVGYLTTKGVGEVTAAYAEHYGVLHAVLEDAPLKISLLRQELSTISSELEAGKRISAGEFSSAADRATELYSLMVPNSEVTAPTATERMWYPIGAGFGAALILGISAAAFTSSLRRGNNYY